MADNARNRAAEEQAADERAAEEQRAAFVLAWTRDQRRSNEGPDLLPTRLAQACVEVLDVAAAGLSLVDDQFRVPLGASDADATVAERLQFTQGEGPCLTAARSATSLIATSADMRARWPSFARELSARTPYRAIISVPMEVSPGMRGALDLYFLSDSHLSRVTSQQLAVVNRQIVAALLLAQQAAGGPEAYSGEMQPAWLAGPAPQRRTLVYVATGMVMSRYELTAPDALALLRAYAYGNDTDVDSLARGLVNGDLELERING